MKINSRNHTMDVLKLIASFGVIAIHVKSSTPSASVLNTFFWPLCVPFFYLVSSAYFISGLSHDKPIGLILGRLFKRILVPYICWTIIYIMLFQIKGFMTGRWREFDWWKVTFYGASAVQLYFLPTLLFIHSVSFTAFLLIVKKKILYGVLSAILCGLYFYIGISNGAAGFQDEGCFIGIIYYCILGLFLAKRIRINQGSSLFTFIGIILIIFTILMNYLGNRLYVFDYPLIFLSGATGVVFTGLGVMITRLPKWLLVIIPLSFGIYLSHVIFLEFFEFLVESKSKNIVYDFKLKLILVSIIFIISSISVYLAMKIRIFKELLFGEVS